MFAISPFAIIPFGGEQILPQPVPASAQEGMYQRMPVKAPYTMRAQRRMSNGRSAPSRSR